MAFEDLLASAFVQSLPLLVAVITLLLGYWLNQRVSREAFAREKRFDNTRVAFQKIVESLRELDDEVDTTQYSARIIAQHQQDEAPREVKALVYGLPLSVIGMSLMNSAEDTARLEQLLTAPLGERSQEWFERLSAMMQVASMQRWERARRAFVEATSAAYLLGAGDPVLRKAFQIQSGFNIHLQEVNRTMHEFTGAIVRGQDHANLVLPARPEGRFEMQIAELQVLMGQELAKIIGLRRAYHLGLRTG